MAGEATISLRTVLKSRGEEIFPRNFFSTHSKLSGRNPRKYIRMDYLKVYANLISRATQRPPPPGSELHHIIPRSWSGTDLPENLVRLTVREHFLAHLLLSRLDHRQLHSAAAFLTDYHRPDRPLRFHNPALRPTTFRRRIIQRSRRFRQGFAKYTAHFKPVRFCDQDTEEVKQASY